MFGWWMMAVEELWNYSGAVVGAGWNGMQCYTCCALLAVACSALLAVEIHL